jgi:hypothetical protein
MAQIRSKCAIAEPRARVPGRKPALTLFRRFGQPAGQVLLHLVQTHHHRF